MGIRYAVKSYAISSRLTLCPTGKRVGCIFFTPFEWSRREYYRNPYTKSSSKRGGRHGATRMVVGNTLMQHVSPEKSAHMGAESKRTAIAPLACPGGPRMKSEGIKYLYKVPHAGYLAKYDQRFVLNLKLTHQIATYITNTTLKTSDKVIMELGPGPGSLTRSLLTRPCVGVLGVEADLRFNPHLQQIASFTKGKFRWVNADILNVSEVELLQKEFPHFVSQHQRHPPSPSGDSDQERNDEEAPLRSDTRERILRQRMSRYGHTGRNKDDTSDTAAHRVTSKWWSHGDAKLEVVANLPFRIVSELLLRYAVDCSRYDGIFSFGRVPLHLFAQCEIAERIVAPAGSLHFSKLSVACQCYFHVKVKQTFTEWTYYPRTEVKGALLTLEPRSTPLAQGLDGGVLLHFVDHLMPKGCRGAVVHKSLSKFMPPEVAQYILQESRIDGAVAVLDLTVEEIVGMASLWRRFIQAAHKQ